MISMLNCMMISMGNDEYLDVQSCLEGQNTTIFTSLENPNQTLSHGFDPSSYYKWVLLLNRIINTPVPDKIHQDLK